MTENVAGPPRRSPLNTIGNEIVDWIAELSSYVPARTGSVLRTLVYSKRLKHLGPGSRFATGFTVTDPENISIGERFHVMRNSCLYANGNGRINIGDRVSLNSNVCIDSAERGEIEIGSDVLMGPNVVIRASDHRFGDVDRPVNQQGHSGGRIVIENDVWLGGNVVVVAGVTIGAHSVIGAGAVVTRDIDPYSIAIGIPARAVGHRQDIPQADVDKPRPLP
jgi:galactoside O-acetyltransferase